MNPLLKFLLLPLAICACIGAGSIFSELNNFINYEAKYSLDASTTNWFSFAVNASVLVGIVPSILYKKFGPKKSILMGGLALTLSHVGAGLILGSSLGSKVSTFLLFLIAIIGGQGACIIFLASAGAMLKQHSIICTALINGLLFTYFLGSDTFHQALKYGVFSDFTLQMFLFIIAGLGAVIYFLCALLFQKKAQGKSEDKSIAKGLATKRSVQMYAAVQAAYLVVIFLLMITAQLSSYWGSRLLMVIIALNLAVPVISFSLIQGSASGLKNVLGNPTDTDKFMTRKGKHVTFKQAREKYEFWLILFAFSILIGLSKMMDENATLIALSNTTTSSQNQRSFQVFEILGSFSTGVFLSLFRVHVSPYFLFMFYAFLIVASQILMFFIGVSSLALYLAVIIVGFCEGGLFVLAGIIAHEDYGSKKYNRILGIFMTGAALGILVFEKVVFDWMYSAFSDSTASLSTYGKWNKYIFIVGLLSSVAALVMSIGAFARTKKSEKEGSIGDFVNF